MTLQTIEPNERETGDATYATRVERFNYIVGRRAEKPQPTLKQIGEELGISKQNVGRLLRRGTVKPSGRQRSNEGRKTRLGKRLVLWSSRRAAKLTSGLDVSVEDKWIADIESQIKALG